MASGLKLEGRSGTKPVEIHNILIYIVLLYIFIKPLPDMNDLGKYSVTLFDIGQAY
jgi:hypothetical protein